MSKLRKAVRELSRRARSGNREAVQSLLSHSIWLGHSRLALRRLLLLQEMGGQPSGLELEFCVSFARTLDREVLLQMQEDARQSARIFLNRADPKIPAPPMAAAS